MPSSPDPWLYQRTPSPVTHPTETPPGPLRALTPPPDLSYLRLQIPESFNLDPLPPRPTVMRSSSPRPSSPLTRAFSPIPPSMLLPARPTSPAHSISFLSAASPGGSSERASSPPVRVIPAPCVPADHLPSPPTSSPTRQPVDVSDGRPKPVDEPSYPSPASNTAQPPLRVPHTPTSPSHFRRGPFPARAQVALPMHPNQQQEGPSRSNLSQRPVRPPTAHSLSGYSDVARRLAHSPLNLEGYTVAYSSGNTFILRAINTDFLPQPVLGDVALTIRTDGRCGQQDYLNWPQLFSPEKPYLGLIPHRPWDPQHPAHVLWERPSLSDLSRVNNHPDGEAFGRLKETTLKSLYRAVQHIKSALARYRSRGESKLAQYRDWDAHTSRALASSVDLGKQQHFLQSRLAELTTLEARLSLAVDIFSGPATYGQTVLQWAHVHRCYAESWAWLEWQSVAEPLPHNRNRSLNEGLSGAGVMGVFCGDAQVALKMHRAGVPVWIVSRVHTVSDSHPRIGTIRLPQDADFVVSIPESRCISRSARAGSESVATIWRLSSSVVDFDNLSLPGTGVSIVPSADQPVAGPSQASGVSLVTLALPQRVVLITHHLGFSRTSKQSKQPTPASGGRERIPEQLHPLLPRRIGVWQSALDRIDFSRPCADSRLGLYVPEAEFLVSVQNLRRLYTYASNWLRVRSGILRLLTGIALFTPPRPESWRTLLGRFPLTAGYEQHRKEVDAPRHKRKLEACKLFTDLLGEDITLHTDMPESVVWEGTVLPSAAFTEQGPSNLPPEFSLPLRQIAWELSELGFRFELYALDRHLVPEAGSTHEVAEHRRRALIHRIFAGTHFILPDRSLAGNAGIGALHVRDRASGLEALRLLICRWPGSPTRFRRLAPLSAQTPYNLLRDFEQDAANVYCQRFYEWSNRAPVVPRVFPC